VGYRWYAVNDCHYAKECVTMPIKIRRKKRCRVFDNKKADAEQCSKEKSPIRLEVRMSFEDEVLTGSQKCDSPTPATIGSSIMQAHRETQAAAARRLATTPSPRGDRPIAALDDPDALGALPVLDALLLPVEDTPLSVGVAEASGYAEPKGFTSKGSDWAKMSEMLKIFASWTV